MVLLELRRDSRVMTGNLGFLLLDLKSNLPFRLRGGAGDCARVTAGQKRPNLGLCPGSNVALQGRQGSRVAFQTHPVSQASARGEAKDSDILLGHDRYLLEPTEWPPGSQASCGVGERTRDCSPGHTGREGPQLAMTGASCGFSRVGAQV